MTGELSIPVTALVEFACRSGDLGAGPGGPTASEGVRVHRRLQERREPGFKAEAKVEARLEVEGVAVTLSGRVDLLRDDAAHPVIEEIKSCLGPPNRLPSGQIDVHWAQLKVYGFCHLSGRPAARATLRMTWHDILADRSYVEAADCAEAQLQAFTTAAVTRYVRWWCRVAEHRALMRRGARQLAFPHGDFRPGQRAMAASVYCGIRDGAQRLIEAPTGIGKTVSALFPAVKALGEERIARVIYLTAKNSGRVSAQACLDALSSGGLAIASLQLRARALVCPCRNGGLQRDAEGRCAYTVGFYDRLPPAREELLGHRRLDGAAIDAAATRHRLCPFELALQMLPWVDVIICDYNYVFDPLAGLGMLRDDGAATSLLLDEAHNLVDRARAMFSARLTRGGVAAAASGVAEAWPTLARDLRAVGAALQRWGRAAEGPESLSDEPPPAVLRAIQRTQQTLQVGTSPPAALPEPVVEVLRELHRFAAIAELYGPHHRCLTRCHSAGRYREVGVRLACLDASESLARAYALFQSVSLFSATLSPPHYYRRALGLDQSCPVQVLPSPFGSERLGVLLYPGVDTRFRHREGQVEAIATLIHAIYARRPGNYLAFFSSYHFMDQVAQACRRHRGEPAPLVQRRDGDENQRRAFLDHFRPGAQTLGFAIMGGVFGEGVDYAGDALIGAMLVGVGLPALDTERELIRADYAAGGLDGYDFAYRFPGMARVLQAAGRVIRHERDRGVVVLLDRRFARRDYRELLPAHWQPQTCRDEAALVQALEDFWARGD